MVGGQQKEGVGKRTMEGIGKRALERGLRNEGIVMKASHEGVSKRASARAR